MIIETHIGQKTGKFLQYGMWWREGQTWKDHLDTKVGINMSTPGMIRHI